MKKKITTFLILLFLSTSCASRKVDIKKEIATVKTDSVSVIKKDVVTTQENNVNIVTNTDEIEIIPIDTTKPITVDGKKYHNVKIRHKKTKSVLSDNTKIKVADKSLIKAKVKRKIEMMKKDVDKKPFYTIIWWWVLIILLIIIGYYTYKKVNNTLF
jgi:lipopolysaccharide export system protein LptA